MEPLKSPFLKGKRGGKRGGSVMFVKISCFLYGWCMAVLSRAICLVVNET